tara:strand:- start:536 stop:649 length:114 start_codon:yes stop_codon:yes gene_type:complete
MVVAAMVVRLESVVTAVAVTDVVIQIIVAENNLIDDQ